MPAYQKAYQSGKPSLLIEFGGTIKTSDGWG